MVRGTFVFITEDVNQNKHIYMSTEFNGGMCLDNSGYGKEVVDNYLNGFRDLEDFKGFVKRFNEEHFGYPEELVYEITERDIKEDNFTFENVTNFFRFADWSYHSDYYFFYNDTTDDIEVLAANGVVKINVGGGAVFNYDKFKMTELDSGLISSEESYEFEDEAQIYEFMNKGLTREEAEEASGYSYIHEICGVYNDYEDYGIEIINELIGVESWLENYIDYEKYARDIVNDDGSKLLSSGRIITYS